MFKPKHSHLDASAKDEIERKRQLINRIKVSAFSYRPITDKNCLSRTKKLQMDHLFGQSRNILQLSLRLSLNLRKMFRILIEIRE